MQNEVKFVLQA